MVPSIAGPKRPQDRVALTDAKRRFRAVLGNYVADPEPNDGVADTFPASDPVADQPGDTAADEDPGEPPRRATRCTPRPPR